uniref:Uncharacterized protein n=1 Tax=Odontella aurita TaxID=265563 RepID=A0A7S4JC56_9STRA|mmetsp:Transcript_43486/g.132316  ORF Transcript_43486/g.132316 Transcript_43486/m.132316 type:complete len:149 (+) Transcript_43486:74-520(+)|eukprot:CAMPEP_0113600414 /NCGR_PEP_ID=MMETSP0015_2-20120614/42692_1 /TAXON_ID=2838 /ORGANISM="Odontella" /LENGTH=148 /DNA_ID=CAMNT_0000508665 /DNA_START=16 /DNA_END=462 /DNA_ORIENTATION=- /assembly_acc=CAM_ASM_000160
MHRLVLSAVRTASRAASRPRAHVASFSAVQYRSFSSEEIIPGVGKGKTSTGLEEERDISLFVAKNRELLNKLEKSTIARDAPYRVNAEIVAKYRVSVAKESGGNPKKIVGQCAIDFTKSKTLGDLIAESEAEIRRMEEYDRKGFSSES